MKRIFLFALLIAFALAARAQNLTSVSASNLQDINGAKLASGQPCFLVTDQNDAPISVQVGGGGQALKRGYCSTVTNGAATTFTVPNPASTLVQVAALVRPEFLVEVDAVVALPD